MDSKKVAALIGVLFGVAVVVVAVTKVPFAWNHNAVMSLRSTFGDTVAVVFLIGVGIIIALSSIVGLVRRAR
jgi:hypothetical protein